MSGQQPVRYGGWTKDRPGWFLGLGAGAWATVVAGLLPAVLAAGVHRYAVATALLPAWMLVTALVAVPVRGRSAARWCADLLFRRFGRLAGWTDWQSRAAAGTVTDVGQADLPGVLSGIRVHDGPPYGPRSGRPALVADHRARTWAVVGRLEHPGIGLVEASTRARLGAGLAEVLEGAATSGLVALLALQVRTVPDDGAAGARWSSDHLHPRAPRLAREVTADAADLMTRAAVRHEVFLTVVVADADLKAAAGEAGGGIDGRGRVLHGLMSQLEHRVTGALGATSLTWLDSSGLADVIRSGFAPGDEPGAMPDGPTGDGRDGPWPLPLAAAGPTSAPPPGRRWYIHDAWATASCTVLLPDKGAVMGALAPILAPGTAGERRSLTVFFEPLGSATADRLVGAEGMSSELSAELRRRGGFRVRAAHVRDAGRVLGQDVQLAEGSALVRIGLAAAVTVSAGWPIADFGRRLEASITESGFVPLRLDLAQDTGFAAACLPLGIGLPRRRGFR